jgi:DNA-binding NarL/FixJ family response regulator
MAIRLVHWNEDEGLERQKQLEVFGFDTAFDFGDGVFNMRLIRSGPPDAVVIDLSRLPSHGREVAQGVRSSKATRHLPIVFVGGEPEKVARTRQRYPTRFTPRGDASRRRCPRRSRNRRKPPLFPITTRHGASRR